MDKIKPLKLETSIDGTELDVFPTETNPSEDYVSTKGIAFENSDTQVLDLSPSGELRYKDSAQAEYKTLNSIGADFDKILFDDTSDILNDDEYNLLVED